MRGRPDCPLCAGMGYTVQGRFPESTATTCGCVKGRDLTGIPRRYEGATLDSFRAWWLSMNKKAVKEAPTQYQQAWDAYADAKAKGKAEAMDSDISVIGWLGPIYPSGYDPTPQNLENAVLPMGLSQSILTLASPGAGETFWVHGPSRSGKTTLAVAMLKARCEATGGSGVYASAVTIGDALRSYYNRTLGAGTWSERISMVADPREIYGGLLEPECLVLDSIDCIPPDRRVAEHFITVLSERDAAAKTTILSAFECSGRLQGAGRHPFSAYEQSGLLAMGRLAEAAQIQMAPAIEAALKKVGF